MHPCLETITENKQLMNLNISKWPHHYILVWLLPIFFVACVLICFNTKNLVSDIRNWKLRSEKHSSQLLEFLLLPNLQTDKRLSSWLLRPYISSSLWFSCKLYLIEYKQDITSFSSPMIISPNMQISDTHYCNKNYMKLFVFASTDVSQCKNNYF